MNEFIETFGWESKEQRESFLSLIKWLRDRGCNGIHPSPLAAFLFQKDHENTTWIMEVMGDRVRRLEDEIALLRTELHKQGDVVR